MSTPSIGLHVFPAIYIYIYIYIVMNLDQVDSQIHI